MRQGGYFTARQAQALGYVRNNHGHHVATGAWLREAHGLFRLADVPQPDPALAELHLWLLWTMGRNDSEPPGALAQETAMVVYGMSDLMLDKVHLWVPFKFRRSVLPAVVVLHRGPREANDIEVRGGLRVVRPLPTLIDLLRDNRVSREHIEKGMHDALARGVLAEAEITQLAGLSPETQILNRWILDVR
jgi:hypothetical protein